MKVECSKIILIEDDPSLRDVLRECLEIEGYSVETFVNGKEALAGLARNPRPCLILLDLMMPVMNGTEFMKEFSKLDATIVPIPVFLCSAIASPEDVKRLAVQGFIKKPVDLNILLKIVDQYCKPSERDTESQP